MSFMSFGFLSLSELKKKKIGKLPKDADSSSFSLLILHIYIFPLLLVVLKLCLSFIPLYVPSSLVFLCFQSINFFLCLISLFPFLIFKNF